MKTRCYIFFLIMLTTVICADYKVWNFHSFGVSSLSIRDDKVWGISSTGKNLISWDKTSKKWTTVDQGCERISLGTNFIYGVDASNNLGKHAIGVAAPVYEKPSRLLLSASWTDLHKTVLDIKVGTKNDIYYVGTDNAFYKFDETAGSGTRVGATQTGIKIAPTPDGKAWAIDTSNKIIQWTGSAWQSVTGSAQARDIIVDGDGIPYIVTTTARPDGYKIMKWDASSSQWVLVPDIGGVALAFDASNTLYVVTSSNRVYYEKCNKDGTFYTAGRCQLCPKNCATCSDWKKCQSCKTNYFLSKDRCFEACPTGTYLSAGLCKACLNGCTKCADALTCQSCIPGYGLSNNVCVLKCTEGTYPSSSVCQACPDGCKKCTDAKTCQSCQETYAMFNKLCVLSCPDGTYKDSAICKRCPSTCATCDATSCQTCKEGFGLSNGKCVASCPVGKYLSAGVCQDCSTGCARCTDANTCQACKADYGLSDKKCVSTCPDGTFMSGRFCQGCSSKCTTCINTVTCKKCANGKVLSNNQCITSCPEGTSAVNGVCQSVVVLTATKPLEFKP